MGLTSLPFKVGCKKTRKIKYTKEQKNSESQIQFTDLTKV